MVALYQLLDEVPSYLLLELISDDLHSSREFWVVSKIRVLTQNRVLVFFLGDENFSVTFRCESFESVATFSDDEADVLVEHVEFEQA